MKGDAGIERLRLLLSVFRFKSQLLHFFVGILWVLLNPVGVLFTIAIISFLFSRLLLADFKNTSIFLEWDSLSSRRKLFCCLGGLRDVLDLKILLTLRL
jgi:hypothetical protein